MISGTLIGSLIAGIGFIILVLCIIAIIRLGQSQRKEE